MLKAQGDSIAACHGSSSCSSKHRRYILNSTYRISGLKLPLLPTLSYDQLLAVDQEVCVLDTWVRGIRSASTVHARKEKVAELTMVQAVAGLPASQESMWSPRLVRQPQESRVNRSFAGCRVQVSSSTAMYTRSTSTIQFSFCPPYLTAADCTKVSSEAGSPSMI